MSQSTSHPTTQLAGLPASQSVSQPMDRPVSRPMNRPTSQPTSRPTNHPTSHPRIQQTSQPTNQPTSQPTNQPTSPSASQPPYPQASQITGQLTHADTFPSLDTILGAKVPTFHHVPKIARDAWAGLLGDLLSSLSSDATNLESWSKLFMVARCILVSPKRRGCPHWRDVRKLVCTRIKRWRAGNIMQLWAEALEEGKGTRYPKRHKK